MVRMPTMLLPAVVGGRNQAAPLVEKVREQLGHSFKLIHRYPLHTRADGSKPLAVTCDGIEVTHPVENINVFEQALERLDPDWTTMNYLWYTRWGAVRDVATVASRHSGRLIVGCTGANIAPDVPEDIIIGIDNHHQRSSKEPQVPVEQLVGRDVCIIGGVPRRQFTTFCELTAQGVNVVAVYWSVCWYYNPMRTKLYWDVHLNTQQEKNWDQGTLMLEGMKNALAWWTLGLRRINKHLTSAQSTIEV